MALGVACFYFWTVESASANLNLSGQKGDYYNLLVDGFADGHLYMKADPDPRLLALPPAERPGNAPFKLDASLYQGRYYLYFGVSPVMLLYLPYVLLTGHDMPEALAAVIFMLAGFGFATVWWWEVRRRFFPHLGAVWVLLGVLAIGLCTAVPSTLRRPMFYEVAIGAGYAFTTLALWAVTRAWHRPRQRWWWLVTAGGAVGLAVGSRANLAPAGLLLLVAGATGIAWGGAAGGTRARLLVLGLLAAGSGAGAVGAGLAAYNYARFGDVAEFGHHHQLGTNPKQMFRWQNLRYNFALYYLKPPTLNGYFPFVAPAEEGTKPLDYVGREHVHGEWAWTLVVGLAMVTAAGLAVGREGEGAAVTWVPVGALAGLLFGVNMAVVAMTGVRSNRYMVDFHPALVLVTWMTLAAGLAARRKWSGALGVGVAVLVPLATIFNVLASLQVHGFFQSTAPATYSRLAGWADGAVWPLMRMEAAAVGDREVDVQWPGGNRGGRREWFFAAGTKDFRDVILLEYDAAGRARFIFSHGEYGEIAGDWFSIAAGGRSRVRLSGALLLPGVAHPWYGGRGMDERRALKRRMRITVDGQLRLNRDVASYDSSPRLQQWGDTPDRSVGLRGFKGLMISRAAGPLDDTWLRARAMARGALRLRLELPVDRFGMIEPLVQQIGPKGFDALAIDYVRPGFVRLLHDQKGGGGRLSQEFAVDYTQPQWVEVSLPGANDGELGSVNGAERAGFRPDLLSVRWNGRDVFRPEVPLLPATAMGIAFGVNEGQSSAGRLLFGGRLTELPRLEPLGPAAPGLLIGKPSGGEAMAIDRGLWLRLERDDGENAAILWQRVKESGLIRIGWVEREAVRWLAWMSPTDAAASEVRLQIPKLTRQAKSPAGWIGLDVRGQAVSACKSDFFAKGKIRAWGINPRDWKAVPPAQSGEWKDAGEQRLPGRMQLRFLLPPGGITGADPLISVGRAGVADSVFLKGVGGGRYTLGLDHWGLGATETAPFELEPGSVQTLVIELGSLDPEGVLPRDRVRLILNGRVVMDAAQALYPVRPEEIVFGQNPHGMSTSNAVFRGEIVSIRAHEPAVELR